MLERIKDVLRNRKAESDKGFSLVELAVVIVIIGILVAIAIPVFGNIQKQAQISAGQAAVSNAAASAASILAAEPATTATELETALAGLATNDVTAFVVTTSPSGATLQVANFCITGTPANGLVAADLDPKGPGC